MSTMLDRELEVISSIRRITRAVDLQSRKLVETFGLTGPQLVTLREAARLTDASPGMIARAVNLSQPTLTGILDRLDKRGLIVRARNGRDRRSVTVTVTTAGLALLAEAPSPLQERFRNEFRKLAQWEQTQMLATLQRVASMMDAERIQTEPESATDQVMSAVSPGQDPATEQVSDAGRRQTDPAAERPERDHLLGEQGAKETVTSV